MNRYELLDEWILYSLSQYIAYFLSNILPNV